MNAALTRTATLPTLLKKWGTIAGFLLLFAVFTGLRPAVFPTAANTSHSIAVPVAMSPLGTVVM